MNKSIKIKNEIKNIIKRTKGIYSKIELFKLKNIVYKIAMLRDTMMNLSDEELKNKTNEFKESLKAGKTLDDLLIEAFAVVREVSRRVLGIEPYLEQLFGGIILHQGRIIEMKTGEGKTLVSALPVYLNALSGKGVNVVTVNEYLVKRDAELMGKIYKFLGLTVGVSLNDMETSEKKLAYNSDITYVTNSEIGFDYLRDNMVSDKEDIVLRDFEYVIIDEVDSVLIDEARTPLIISGPSDKTTKLYEVCDSLVRSLTKGRANKEFSKIDAFVGEEIEEFGDFIVNEKDNVVTLTKDGIKKVEKFFNITNYSDLDNLEIQHNINLALRAHHLMSIDKDYVVKDGEVLIVDEFTGRIMNSRRFSDGLHQAIEAKEGVKIREEGKTYSFITLQNFFNKYKKKAGMTGTAMTESKEFKEIYSMDVIDIPTHEKLIRKDLNDYVYRTKKIKYKAIIDDIVETHAKGQPILVGTISIDVSELISKMLKTKGIKHNVLNAKYHEQEANIIKNAGVFGSVTIATNMAGRGTDIQIDEKSKKVGGLKIIGTERHEARRIDNQLRGRSGRQGDPGESRFYVSLEDDLIRLFVPENKLSLFNSIGEDVIEHRLINKIIERAQKKIEGNHFSSRKHVLEYDKVLNEQRDIIFEERRKIILGESMKEFIVNMINSSIYRKVNKIISNADYTLKDFNDVFYNFIPIDISDKDILSKDSNIISDILFDKAYNIYQDIEKSFNELQNSENMMLEEDEKIAEDKLIRDEERKILLRVIDYKWMNYIDDMEQLKQCISLQAYGQKDPVVEYRGIVYEMFNAMSDSIEDDVVSILFKLNSNELIHKNTEKNKKYKINKNIDFDSISTKINKEKKIYPNDLCPCGSGKKYKNCCGKN